MDKKHKAMKFFYKEGVKNVGEETTKKRLNFAFNKPKHKALEKAKMKTAHELYTELKNDKNKRPGGWYSK